MKSSVSRTSAQWLLTLLVLIYALLAGGYFVLRYAGQWSDSDTANLTLATAAVAAEARLVPGGDVYELGFAYQAVSTFVTACTGLSVSQLQFLVYPLLAPGLASVAFVLYRALTGDATIGALATFLLFLQPDFLFAILRGSHEKATWLAAMLALFLLTKSFLARRLSRFAACVLLFYLSAFSLIASNTFFGSSFIVAIVVSLAAGLVVLRRSSRSRPGADLRPTVVRLTYVAAGVIVVWFIVTFYLYPSAATALAELQQSVDRAAAVALGQEPQYDPYANVRLGWASRTAYFGVTSPTWIAASLSFVAWARVGFDSMLGGSRLERRQHLLMWLLYAGFGLQLGVALALSYTGGVSGNIQLRLFPAVMLLAFPLLTWAYAPRWTLKAPAQKHLASRTVLAVAILWAAGASLLKATNEPWLSNYWQFWTGSEDQAAQWVESHVRYRSVWLGLDGIRVSSHAVGAGFGAESGNSADTWVMDTETQDVLASAVDERLSVRRSVPLPDVGAEQRVYDNGIVAHYHLRPRTRYQR